jgi:hypothetical protein
MVHVEALMKGLGTSQAVLAYYVFMWQSSPSLYLWSFGTSYDFYKIWSSSA